jgi:hypothetical protein
MLQAYLFKCFSCFRGTFQVFQKDVAKVDQDISNVLVVLAEAFCSNPQTLTQSSSTVPADDHLQQKH